VNEAGNVLQAISGEETQDRDLRSLLKQTHMRSKLSNLTSVMLSASNPQVRLSKYEPASLVFCDGIEVFLGQITPAVINRTRMELLGGIHAAVKELTVKNLLVTCRRNVARIWVTFSPDCTHLTTDFMKQLRKLL
jgi:hypothetical protein